MSHATQRITDATTAMLEDGGYTRVGEDMDAFNSPPPEATSLSLRLFESAKTVVGLVVFPRWKHLIEWWSVAVGVLGEGYERHSLPRQEMGGPPGATLRGEASA